MMMWVNPNGTWRTWLEKWSHLSFPWRKKGLIFHSYVGTGLPETTGLWGFEMVARTWINWVFFGGCSNEKGLGHLGGNLVLRPQNCNWVRNGLAAGMPEITSYDSSYPGWWKTSGFSGEAHCWTHPYLALMGTGSKSNGNVGPWENWNADIHVWSCMWLAYPFPESERISGYPSPNQARLQEWS
jgi:hypothetical protein